MGTRVVELKEVGLDGILGYAVYQSTAMAMFDPIFHAADENRARLQAECFAVGLHFIYPLWTTESQNRLAMAIVLEIIDRYGEDRRGDQQVGMAIDDPEVIESIARIAYGKISPAIKK